MFEQGLGRRLEGDSGQRAAQVRFVKTGMAQPRADGILAKPSQGLLISRGEQGKGVGVAMPVAQWRRMGEGELDGRVNGLAALDSGRQIASGHDKQLPEWHVNTIPVAVNRCQPATARERSNQKLERYWS